MAHNSCFLLHEVNTDALLWKKLVLLKTIKFTSTVNLVIILEENYHRRVVDYPNATPDLIH